MFICDFCGKTVPPSIKSVEVITKIRRREYPFRSSANRPATWKEEKADRIASQNDNGGVGWEAAETKLACPQCARKVQQQGALG